MDTQPKVETADPERLKKSRKILALRYLSGLFLFGGIALMIMGAIDIVIVDILKQTAWFLQGWALSSKSSYSSLISPSFSF